MRIEMVQIPLDFANQQMQQSNRSSPGLSDPPKPKEQDYVCQDPPRALDFGDDYFATAKLLKDLCTNGGASPEGVKMAPNSALSVTSRTVRVSVCSFLTQTRCDPDEMLMAWDTLDHKCPLPAEDFPVVANSAGFVFGDGRNNTYQREACEDATVCGMINVPCQPVP